MKDRLDHYAEAIFHQQYLNSQWYSQSDRALFSDLTKEWLNFIEEGKSQEILKDAPASLMSALFLGSIRETADLMRGKVLSSDDETLDMAFALYWDAIKA